MLSVTRIKNEGLLGLIVIVVITSLAVIYSGV